MARIFMDGFEHGDFEDWNKIIKNRFFKYHYGDEPMADEDDIRQAINSNMRFLEEFYTGENMVLPSRIIELVCEDLTHGRGDIKTMLKSGNIRQYILSLTMFHKENWIINLVKDIKNEVE